MLSGASEEAWLEGAEQWVRAIRHRTTEAEGVRVLVVLLGAVVVLTDMLVLLAMAAQAPTMLGRVEEAITEEEALGYVVLEAAAARASHRVRSSPTRRGQTAVTAM